MTVKLAVDAAGLATAITTTAALTDGAITVGGTNATNTTFNNGAAGKFWPKFRAVFSGTFGTSTGIDGRTVDLYARHINVDGTADEEAPSTTDLKSLHYLTSFRLNEQAGAQAIVAEFDAPGFGEFDLHIQQNGGGSSSLNSGATVKIVGFSVEDS